MTQIFIRFLVGGLVVSSFAIIGDLLKPKSLAGLFGAAPSVALATLALTVAGEGRLYVAAEARSMIAGAIAFFVYASLVSWILMRGRFAALRITIAAMPVWFGMALAIWAYWLK
jgi:hypothetical protein